MSLARRVISVYGRIGRTYWSSAPSLLLIGLVVFLPLGLLDAIGSSTELEAVDLDDGVRLAAMVAAIGFLTTTSLLGQVFFSGAVAIFLIGRDGPRPASLLAVARRLDYRRLIAVDLLYVAIVVAGLLLFVVPGLLAFVWLALTGPVLEIEGRGVRSALRRSFQLVRGSFWLVALVLIPIEVVGESLGESAEHLVHVLLGESFLATWLAESAANLVFSPLFAVAALLLTLHLIAERDGGEAEARVVRGEREAAAT